VLLSLLLAPNGAASSASIKGVGFLEFTVSAVEGLPGSEERWRTGHYHFTLPPPKFLKLIKICNRCSIFAPDGNDERARFADIVEARTARMLVPTKQFFGQVDQVRGHLSTVGACKKAARFSVLGFARSASVVSLTFELFRMLSSPSV